MILSKMLRLIEKDLMITEVSYETFQKKTLIVDAVFSPAPHTCRNCGSTVVDGNGKVIVVKNGKKETIVRFEQYNHMPLVMRLKSSAIPVKLSNPLDGSKLFCSTQAFNRESCQI